MTKKCFRSTKLFKIKFQNKVETALRNYDFVITRFITNILAGSVSPGLDAPRVAGSFPLYVCYIRN